MLHLDLVTIVVDDYDRAIDFYVGTLGFVLTEDTKLTTEKRWVVIRPSQGSTGFLIARADSAEQSAAIGRQTGGRVSLFLHTDDIDEQIGLWSSRGVQFEGELRTEPYGRVVVFVDIYGNRWDLIEPQERR
ncbi:MAG: VOC family protein [Acidimicrobiia bacterium]|jgi:predicted enzyme related to lactoylglutathione lyase|nr:VOC family protein [Acidimicrobiia bacterium]